MTEQRIAELREYCELKDHVKSSTIVWLSCRKIRIIILKTLMIIITITIIIIIITTTIIIIVIITMMVMII